MKPPEPSEIQIQAAIVEWLNRCVHCVVFAVPNGGKRGYGAQMQVRKEGLLKGAPDLVVAYQEGGEPGTLFIEVKSKRGKMREEQAQCRWALMQLGHDHLVARSLDDVIEWFGESQ